MSLKTLVIGASINPSRYSNKAVKKLLENKVEVKALGIKKGTILDVDIVTTKEAFENIHTVTLYLNAKNQEEYYNYIVSLKPKRVIFNPGTENIAFEKILANNAIKFEQACTLVLLSIGAY
ncbi:CoA-binding protein [Lutibacter sp. A64]|uniref:CoA-binding protein n=1 Tax=Lutibacter sp. A64 TaxID=2918526 RepID=UPI001F06730E|nr:CoA-binding protein [Lutibacter sp. A64]UMB55314.1 CoA-binding protein [Lutibacter sp. A64]